MKKPLFLYCMTSIMISVVLSISNNKIIDESSTELLINHSTSMTDTTWKVKPIVKLGDPAPGTGGTFLEFRTCHYMENGTLVFGARYGNKKSKDWAYYTYKNGNVKLLYNTLEKYSEPDGIQKEFGSVGWYFDPQLSSDYMSFTPEASAKLFYIRGQTKIAEAPSYIYGWDGEKLSKVLCEGDKISLTGNRDVIIDDARFEYIANNGEAVIWFKGQKPDKISGWLLHDGKTLRPLFITGDELPGLPGVKVGELDEMSVYIFNDTILTTLSVSGAPYKLAVVRLTKNKTEILDSSSKINRGVSILNAAGSDNIIIQNGETILHYYKGNRNIIVTDFKELKEQVDVKGAAGYEVNGSAFIGTQNEGILFSISLYAVMLNRYGGRVITDRLPGLFFYKDDKLTSLPVYKTYSADNKSKKLSGGQTTFIPIPYYLRTVPNINGVFLYNLPFPKEDTLFNSTRYLDQADIVPALVKPPDLNTEGLIKFSLSDIIAWPEENKIIAKTDYIEKISNFKWLMSGGSNFLTRTTGLYELTR